MKNLCLLCFTILSFSVLAQNKETHSIKIYLEDAETGKNIADAKVTLEGFEIPAITGKYDKTGKYYYFDKIPVGYNTVMAYHKIYNEKGFQDVNSLPKELKLRLYDPLNISYSFEFESFFKSSYVEDPYKISISSINNSKYNDFREFLNLKIKKLNLDIELVNPYWEINKIENNQYNITQKEGYPMINLKEDEQLKGGCLFPLISGVDNVFPEKFYSNKSKDICFILRKKDGSKFKRFNDPIIKKLKEQNLNIYSIVLNKKNGKDLKNDFEIRDQENKKFNLEYKIDSSKVFFYDHNFRNERKPFMLFNFFKKRYYLEFDEPNKYQQIPSFILILNDDYKIPKSLSEMKNKYEEIKKIPFQNDSLGLGILDIYEYYSKVN